MSNNSTTLIDLFKEAKLNSFNKGMGTFGIEIETESKKEYVLPELQYWTQHADGSLRNFGIEYVLSRPLGYGYIDAALKEFQEKTSEIKFIESTYTSVHVHLNFVEKSLLHLFNFFTIYALFEDVLTRYCGPDRDGNLFCLKLGNAEGNFFEIVGMANAIREGTGVSYIRHLNANNLKYSGLNIAPLRSFGSVEVRTHPGTTDIVAIKRWIDVLNGLYQGAQGFANPAAIIDSIRRNSVYMGEVAACRQLFRQMVPKEHLSYFNVYSEDFDKDINNCLWYAYEIATGDWTNFGKARSMVRPRDKFTRRDLTDTTEVANLVAVYTDLEYNGWYPQVGNTMYDATTDM